MGTIFLFIQMSQMLFRPLRQIADKFNSLQMGMVSAERIFEILEKESIIKDEGSFIPTQIMGNISIKKLMFSYTTGEKVINDISLEIKSGEKVALVGATGAGKSTIINLISRLYEFDSGDIEIDGISIRDYDLKSLRNRVSVVLQEVFLFADSLYNNITLYNTQITRDMVIKALKDIGNL